MNQSHPDPKPIREFTRGVTSGRALIAIAIIAVIVLVIIVAVAGARMGEPPEFAMAAPAATPFFAELALTRDVEDLGEQVAESRFVRDEERQAFEEYLERRYEELAEEDPALLQQLRHTMRLTREPDVVPERIALVLTRALSLEDVELDDMVLIAEYRNEEELARAAELLDAEVVETRTIDGQHMLFVGAWPQAVGGVIERLEVGEEAGTLAATEELQEVQAINRGIGLFLYYNARDAYARWLEEQGEITVVAGNPEPEEIERDAARLAGELLPPEQVGGLGIWVGAEQTEMLMPIENNPLAEAQTEGGEAILDYLPRDTFYVSKLSAATEEHRALRRFFRRHTPHFVNLVDAVRRQALEETRDRPDMIEIERIGAHLDHYGDVLEGHVGGGFFQIDPDVREGVGSALVVLVTDPEEARIRLWQARAELDIEERWEARELDINDQTHPAITLGEEHGIVVFHDNAAVYLNRLDAEETFTQRDVVTYMQRLEEIGTITDHPGWNEGMSQGVSFSHTMVSALNVASLAELVELEMAEQDRPLEEQGNPRTMESPLADTFVGSSVNVRGDGLAGYASLGLADLAALMVLTDFALQRHDIEIAEEVREVADEEEIELDEQQLERALDEYYRLIRLDQRDPDLEEFLERLDPEMREQIERLEQPRLHEEENRLILEGTCPQTGEEMRFQVEHAETDLDIQPEQEEEAEE